MPAEKPVLAEQILEVRFERGYRYLDRCGEILLILEDLLAKETGKLWMTGEARPTGAVLKCPELEAVVVIDAKHLVVEQNPIALAFDFQSVCRTIWAVVETRLGITEVSRAGSRRKFVIPTDTVEQAEKLAVRYAPVSNWPSLGRTDLKRRNAEVSCIIESDDRKHGVRVTLSAQYRLGTPLQLDERLRLPPHLLATGQHDALIGQLKRRKEQQKDPDAGLLIDIDIYDVYPSKFKIEDFVRVAHTDDVKYRDELLKARS
jgi:hypothetical protein